MPPAPDVNLWTRYVLENPWPLSVALILAAAWLTWSGLREGLGRRLRAGMALAIVGFAILITGLLVVTSGEHSRVVTEALVEAAVKHDSIAANALFADDAEMSLGSPSNPAYGRTVIDELLYKLPSIPPIESNSITMLRAYSESSSMAMVHLACWTTLASGLGPTPSQWVLRVERQADGSWRISHLTCVSVASQPPQMESLRRY